MTFAVIVSVALVLAILCLCFLCFLAKTQGERINRLETEVKHSVSDEFHRQYMGQFVKDYGLEQGAEED